MAKQDEQAIDDLFAELRRAEAKFPGWPRDLIHGAAIVAEESGELVQAALQATYNEPRDYDLTHAYKEATQVAAMGLRMMLALNRGEVTTFRAEQRELKLGPQDS